MQIRYCIDVNSSHHRRLFGVFFGKYQVTNGALARKHRDRQCAFDRTHATV
jgi:hypothetical protein